MTETGLFVDRCLREAGGIDRGAETQIIRKVEVARVQGGRGGGEGVVRADGARMCGKVREKVQGLFLPF